MGRKQFRAYRVNSADGKARLSNGVRGTQGLRNLQRPHPWVPQLPTHPHTHLEVSVYNAQVVQVLDGIQHLEDEAAGVPLCVKAFFHNSVKQLPT